MHCIIVSSLTEWADRPKSLSIWWWCSNAASSSQWWELIGETSQLSAASEMPADILHVD